MITVLLENEYLTMETDNQTASGWGNACTVTGLEKAVFAGLSEEEQLRILKGEQGRITLTLWEPEEEAWLSAELPAGMEASLYQMHTLIRMEASIGIGDESAVPVERLGDQVQISLAAGNGQEDTETAITTLLVMREEAGGIWYQLIPNEADAGQVKVMVTELSDLGLFSVVEEQKESSGMPGWLTPLLSGLAGLILGGIALTVFMILREKKQNKEGEIS